jgi:hypothetical protein
MTLTCPSLQDRAAGWDAAFCLGPSEARGSCWYIQDVLGGSPSSNADFDCTMPYGSLVDFVYNRDHLQVCFSARASFLLSGKLCFCNSVGSSHVDWGETDTHSAHNGSDSSCFLTSKAIKNRCTHWRKGKSGSKKRKKVKYQELAAKIKALKKIVGLVVTAPLDGFLTAHCGLYFRRR